MVLCGLLTFENPEVMRVPMGLVLAGVGGVLLYRAARDVRRRK